GSPEPPGHLLPSRVLVPSRVLLEPVLPLGPSPLPVESGERILSYGERDTIRQWVAPVAMRTEVDRYSGAAPLRRGVTIASRDVMHLHNRVAVCSLAADLAQLGGGRMVVRLHPFTLNTANSVQCANVEAMLPRSGLGGVVIVCAHLDSRVDPDLDGSPHDPANDPAPGADDNASGIAGVLCAARALLELAGAGTPHREIRFVLFNAEERGLAGSRAYARDRRRMRDEIVAVFNMDMIGYDAVPPSYFEVHAGGSGEAEVIDRSRDLARLVARVASETCEKEVVPQFHLGGDASLPASGHSDHTSFHEVEYPACLICQDLHLDAGGNRDANCAYHTTRDKTVHACYAAEIARAVAAAAWVAATLPR
ncbi:MAG TPA: M28 family metallopeptidase, partial [Longimicrobiaceae bacterium]|nr:M28 family metallopeptidase [Longimicrobiaceae bacterium]